MRGGWPLWTGSAAAAAVLHGAGGALVLWMASPEPPPAQAPGAAARLDLAVVAVPREEARPAAPEARAADGIAAEGTALSGGAVPLTQAGARPVENNPVSAASAQGAPANAVEASGAITEALPPPPRTAEPVAPAAPPVRPSAPSGISAAQTPLPASQAVGATALAAAPAEPVSVPSSVAAPTASFSASAAPAVSTTGTAPPPIPAGAVALGAVPAATRPGTAIALGPPANPVAERAPEATALADLRPERLLQAAFRPEGTSATATEAPATRPASPAVPAAPAAAAAATGDPAPGLAAAGPRADAAAPDTRPAEPAIPEATATTAALAWSGGGATRLSSEALDVVEALISETGPGEGQSVRDGIGSILEGADCARVQTVFRPETGELEVIGHVPDPATGARITAAIEAEIGGALPVTARLRQLPPPQCSVLASLVGAGIPQSTDQFTNPLIIGPDLFARVYDYVGGDRLQLNIAGAEFDAWLYLDYFDSSGQVTHFVPNEAVPPVRLDAQAQVSFGAVDDPDDLAHGRLREIVIGPPFGQDIAVVMISSEPLFEALRPTVEPAEAYLAALSERLPELRAAAPDLKIEFVYLFVQTSPG